MDDSPLACGAQRISNLDSPLRQVLQTNWPSLHALFQRHPFEQLHDDNWLAIVLFHFEDSADVRVIQRRDRSRLLLEPQQFLALAAARVLQHLQGNVAAETKVLGLVDNAHAASVDRSENAVMRDGLARQGVANSSAGVFPELLGKRRDARGRGVEKSRDVGLGAQ